MKTWKVGRSLAWRVLLVLAVGVFVMPWVTKAALHVMNLWAGYIEWVFSK